MLNLVQAQDKRVSVGALQTSVIGAGLLYHSPAVHTDERLDSIIYSPVCVLEPAYIKCHITCGTDSAKQII